MIATSRVPMNTSPTSKVWVHGVYIHRRSSFGGRGVGAGRTEGSAGRGAAGVDSLMGTLSRRRDESSLGGLCWRWAHLRSVLSQVIRGVGIVPAQ